MYQKHCVYLECNFSEMEGVFETSTAVLMLLLDIF